MDEATANIDPVLDKQVQHVVRSSFAQYTVITIAHRLHTVAGYDRVIVMQQGEVVQQGSPRTLLLNQSSLFRQMVIQSAMKVSDNSQKDATIENDNNNAKLHEDAKSGNLLTVKQVIDNFLADCQ